ncbi:MAG: DMT family transporter [Planctomycetota bacterium]
MPNHLLGELYASLAAITWAFALVLYRQSGERVSPMALNLFKNVIGLVLLSLTLLYLGQGINTLRVYPSRDLLILAISGVMGIALADTFFFHALNLIGVGLLSIVDCLYMPFVVCFSWLLLSEQLLLFHYLGGGLILLGVFVSSRHTPPANRTRAQLVLGMLCAALALALMAFSVVVAKPVFERFPLTWAAQIRLLAGTAALILLTLASGKRGEYWAVFRPAAIWKQSIPASVLGMYFALLFWIAGFKYTQASIAAILNQTSVVFALILGTLILKEPFTRRKLVSVVLASAGTILAMLPSLL